MRLDRRLILLFAKAARRERLSSHVYHLLVAEFFSSLSGCLMLPTAGIIFVAYAYSQDPRRYWCFVLALMFALTCGRIWLVLTYRTKGGRAQRISYVTTARYETAFAIIAVGISALVGTAIFIFASSDRPQDVVCALILAMGVAGSISGRNGSRPKIALAQIGAIIAPLIASLAYGPPAFRTLTCGLLTLFILATYLSIKAFYTSLRSSYTNERNVVSLAARLKTSADLLQVALDNMTSGLLFFDKNRRVVIANERVKAILGADLVGKMIGRTTNDFYQELFDDLGMREEEGLALREEFSRIMVGKSEGRSMMIDRRRARLFELKMMPVPAQGAVMNVEDVTEKKEKEQVIYRLAHFDNLTGLANRFTFEQELKQRFASVETRNIVVCYIDLDCFKSINDEYGHQEGDRLLRIVAFRIEAAKRDSDFTARLAGDEFALLLDLSEGAAEVESVVKTILSSIAEGMQLRSSIVKVRASAGLVTGAEALFDAEHAVRDADVALYEAKTSGGGKALWYNQQMDLKARRLRTLTAYLETALDREQLTLSYQPIIDFRTGEMVACEALARWYHPEFGNISPGEFIPLAERSGLIHRLGRWALTQACRDIKAWGHDAVKVAVNISALQFQSGLLSEVVTEALASSGVDASLLEIEITESAIASDPVEMKSTLDRLTTLGVSVALDDFGTGYSSLSLLHGLPISKIKLDRSFVASIDTDPSRARLIASIVQMAQTLQKQLVIEGVENHRELLAVLEAQARFVQGFYFCKPLPFAELKLFSPSSACLQLTGKSQTAVGERATAQSR